MKTYSREQIKFRKSKLELKARSNIDQGGHAQWQTDKMGSLGSKFVSKGLQVGI